MKRRCLVLLLLLFAAVNSSAKGIDTIRQRLITEAICELQVDDAKVEKIVSSFIASDSIWLGINYQDTSRVAFEHTIHLDNMTAMARAYKTESSEWYKSPKLKRVFDISMEFWTTHDFLCANWWNNEIGTPTQMITMLYIMNDDLSQEQISSMSKIASRANMNAWGARQSGDRIRIAGLEAKQHIFNGDEQKLRRTLLIIEGEMTFRNRERGMQRDFSFHHRTDNVNNTTTYGLNFINSFGEWVRLIDGTEFCFSDEKLELAIDYYLDGICKHMVHGRLVDMNSRNRDISRVGVNKVMDVVTPLALLKASSHREKELENIINSRTGGEYAPESFAKYFWESEHFVIQRPRYYSSVRLYSPYNACMEVPYNGEGLLNHFRGDGANLLSHDGYEYSAIIPYLNWQRIPGTTVMQIDKMPSEKEVQKYGLREFVGGVDDGLLGAAAFDFCSPHSNITAKKSWFFFNDSYVCLGAGICSEGEQHVLTTVEQAALNGEVTLKANGKEVELSKGESRSNPVEWVHHNNVGYYFPKVQNTTVQNSEQVGNWRLANIQTTVPDQEVKGDVFQLYIDHGASATQADYSYVVLPYISKEEMSSIKMKEIHILQNDDKIQAVKHDGDNIIYIVFYAAGQIEVDNKTTIAVDQPSILMVRCDKRGQVSALHVSDPVADKERINVTITKGRSLKKYTIDLPQEQMSGSTASLMVQGL